MLREGGLIAEMEREAAEVGLGGWFNSNLEEVPESWSGSNSGASASQDRVTGGEGAWKPTKTS